MTEELIDHYRAETDVAVSCHACNKPLGYVARDTHYGWLCDDCALEQVGEHRVTAIDIEDTTNA